MGTRDFTDLIVWRKSHEFVLAIYKITAAFPKSEMFGLADQLRRSATSIPANIAEGFRRRGKADKARFFNIAEGSLSESRYYLILARDLTYCDTEPCLQLLDEADRLLRAYIAAIRSS